MAEVSSVDRPLPVWRTLVLSRIRSQLSYRSSFVLDLINSFAMGLLEFVELFVLLGVAPVYGGLDLPQVALVYALATTGFAAADLVFGQLDRLPAFIQAGQLEGFLTRPAPLLLQMITSAFQFRRIARLVFGVIALIISLSVLQLSWTPTTVALLIITPVIGFTIYSALFVLAGGCQFWLINGAEFTNAFVYGGKYTGQLPAAVLLSPVRVFFTFVIPTTLTAYLPATLILGVPDAAGLPDWLGWCSPLFAIWIWVVALLVWRGGVGRYTGAGG